MIYYGSSLRISRSRNREMPQNENEGKIDDFQIFEIITFEAFCSKNPKLPSWTQKSSLKIQNRPTKSQKHTKNSHFQQFSTFLQQNHRVSGKPTSQNRTLYTTEIHQDRKSVKSPISCKFSRRRQAR